MKTISFPSSAALLVGALLAFGPVSPAAARIIINNVDGPGEGFNDPTPFVPVGGNPATTLGQARLIAFQYAADIWTAVLESSVDIVVDARFDPLPCTPTSAVLGSAAPVTAVANFANAAPYPPAPANTWHPIALGNAIAGVDLDPGGSDIQANFNSDIDNAACLGGISWYYGLDATPSGGDVDLVSVLLHEFGHGLGFLTIVDITTGARPMNLNDVYMLNLENHGASPSLWSAMSNAQRLAAVTSDPNAHWLGANVLAEAALIPLTAGMASGHVRVHGPNPVIVGSSISHFSTAVSPNDMMEPSYTGPNHNLCLALQLMRDIGWLVKENGDLYVKDRPWDAGLEPNPDTGSMWKTQDIWVRNSSGSGSTVHENPEYSALTPAYVNVRVRNRGCRPASGEVKLYWAKASTGLAWPTHWVGYMDVKPGCSATLFGDEIPTAAPLLITDLPAGDEVIFEVPWDVPNPFDYACFGADAPHFCLLARIETEPAAPFGMTFPEGANVDLNTRRNNNIAWKNVTVVDDIPGLQYRPQEAQVLMRNISRKPARLRLQFGSEHPIPFDKLGRITLHLEPELAERWLKGGAMGRNIEPLGNGDFLILGKVATLDEIVLDPDEMHVLRFGFNLMERSHKNEPAIYDFEVIQFDMTAGEPVLVGGETFSLDLNKFALLPAHARWKYLNDGSDQGKAWRGPGYDDANWEIGSAQFGYGEGDEATILDSDSGRTPIITAYFRTTFTVEDLSLIETLSARLLCDDGCVGYLNGKEIFRYNMRSVGFDVPALASVPDDGQDWHDIQVDPSLLLTGLNLLAVEVHQANPSDKDMSFDLALIANGPPTPPTVALVTPTDGAIMDPGPLTLVAQASDPDGTVERVEIFQGDDLWADLDSPPYRLELENLEPREYYFMARATDNFGNSAMSVPVTVVIQEGCSPLFVMRIGNQVEISWEGDCVLQQSRQLNSPSWVDVPGDPSSPYVTTTPLPQNYYRLRPR